MQSRFFVFPLNLNEANNLDNTKNNVHPYSIKRPHCTMRRATKKKKKKCFWNIPVHIR